MADLLGQRASARDLWTRLTVFGCLAAACFLVLVGRLWHLQVTQGKDYYERSVDNFVKEVKVPADRGLLLDRRGEVLADSRPSFDLYLTPSICRKRCDDVVARLSAYLGLSDDEQAHARQKLKDTRGLARFKPFLVKVDLARDQVDVYEAHRDDIGGAVELIVAPHRNYRLGTLAGHLLGYLSEVGPEELDALQAAGKDYHEGDYIGRRGVERAFESYLRGRDGSGWEEVTARGEPVAHPILIPGRERGRQPTPGDNVVLSIDARLQKVADQTFPGKAGAVVALDPQTGFILAMVSRPEIDPNLMTGRVTRAQLAAMAEDPYKPDMFRPLQGMYHPGSTFKAVTALAGLAHHVITPESHTFCNGGYTFGRRRWRCWKDSGHGEMDLHHAIVHSCDTFFYWVGEKLGLDALAETARALGLGQPTGIGLDNEAAGVIPDVAYHDKVTPGGYQKGFVLNAAIGQGDVNVTPLQLAMTYAAIGNGGTLYRPQVVRRIEDVDGKTVKLFDPVVREKLPVDPDDLAAVVGGLKGVVNEPGGTAYLHRLKDVEVAGKTGTAAVVAYGANLHAKLDYWQNDHGWFAAFAPADKPEIAVVVLNEHAGHGGSAAAPTAMAVIQAYFDEKKEDEAARAVPVTPPEPPAHEGSETPLQPLTPTRPPEAAPPKEHASRIERTHPWS